MLSSDASFDSSSDSETVEMEKEYDLEVEVMSNASEQKDTSDDAGFLLRAGNRLFLPAVQVNVTGWQFHWNIYGNFPTNVRLFKGEIPFRLWEKLLSPSNQCCEDI